jgi:hypothetical protein
MASPQQGSSSPQGWNVRNPAVKRIMQEMREIKEDVSGEIVAEAVEVRP